MVRMKVFKTANVNIQRAFKKSEPLSDNEIKKLNAMVNSESFKPEDYPVFDRDDNRVIVLQLPDSVERRQIKSKDGKPVEAWSFWGFLPDGTIASFIVRDPDDADDIEVMGPGNFIVFVGKISVKEGEKGTLKNIKYRDYVLLQMNR